MVDGSFVNREMISDKGKQGRFKEAVRRIQEHGCFTGTVEDWVRERDLIYLGIKHPPKPSVWSLFTESPRLTADKYKLKKPILVITCIKDFLKDFYREELPPSWHDDIPTEGDGRRETGQLPFHPASELSRVPLDDLFSSKVYGGNVQSYRALALDLVISFLRCYYLFALKRFRGAAAFSITLLHILINEWAVFDLPKLLPVKHVAEGNDRWFIASRKELMQALKDTGEDIGLRGEVWYPTKICHGCGANWVEELFQLCPRCSTRTATDPVFLAKTDKDREDKKFWFTLPESLGARETWGSPECPFVVSIKPPKPEDWAWIHKYDPPVQDPISLAPLAPCVFPPLPIIPPLTLAELDQKYDYMHNIFTGAADWFCRHGYNKSLKLAPSRCVPVM
jgi:hypothetical protein